LSIAPYRLLGLAFASADLLLELAPSGQIAFAVGAAAMIAGVGERDLMGRRLDDFVHEGDRDLIAALIDGVEGAGRQGPATVRLADATRAIALSICRLPQNDGAVSCALSRAAPPMLGAGPGGLHDRASFEAVTKTLFETARTNGEALELSFVEMDGLADAAAALTPERRSSLEGRIAGALRAQSKGGAAAAKFAEDRYALIRDASDADDAFAERLTRLVMAGGEAGAVTLATRGMALNGEVSPAQVVRTLRYALDGFIAEGIEGAGPASLEEAVGASLRHTLKKADALGAAVAEQRFSLFYQPVVNLKTGALHHHEALVRFGPDESPFPLIRMAEELDLIEALDLAVVQRAARELAADEKLRVAVNVSGRTITSAAFIAKVSSLVKQRRGLSEQLLFEITESATIDDLPLADRHIQTLRDLGCQVCLDDFGAGAASLAYLQQLKFDLVKIDGRYIRQLQHGKREATFIRHLVGMCAELGVKTVAEMVETASCEEAVRLAGVDFGQGYFYGAPSERPTAPAVRGASAARRRGTVESWG
jgi:EAL domain-containing protein (putative c-di-GMP-specific phosphodiesterase class I)/PAS domain-containing protein